RRAVEPRGVVHDRAGLSRADVLTARVAGHGLHRRGGSISDAAARCGVRDAHGSALLAFHARTDGVTQESLDAAIDDGSLITVASARGTTTLVPAADVAVFTLGTLPAGEESLR